MLSLLALSLKNSLILGCDSATSSEFEGCHSYYFFFLFTDIIHMVGFVKVGKFPKTGLFKQTESYELPFLSMAKYQHCK